MTPPAGDFDAARLYDEHPDYLAKRDVDSPHYVQWREEVLHWKIPNLLGVLPPSLALGSVCEVGCATGELIGLIPLDIDASRRTGIDISPENVEVARARFPGAHFRSLDIFEYRGEPFDLVILSDILEHVPDDVGFLRRCGELGKYVLLNLPLEKCLVNRGRAYGPGDESGHLRAYGLEDGFELIRAAGLEPDSWRVRWYVDHPQFRAHFRRRQAQRRATASATTKLFWRLADVGLSLVPGPVLHRVFPSNLFVLLAHPRA